MGPLEATGRKLAQLRAYRMRTDDTARNGAHDLAGFCKRTDSSVYVELGSRDSLVVGLAHLRVEGADQIEVLARVEPGAAHQWLLRQSRAAHDVGPADRRLEIIDGLDAQLRAVQGCSDGACAFAAPTPNSHFPNGPHPGVAFDEMRRKLPRADHRQARSLRSGQIPRGQRRRGAGAPQSKLLAVEQRPRYTGRGVEQHISGGDRRQALRRIVGIDGHELDAERTGSPRRHHEKRAAACAGLFDGVLLTRGNHGGDAKSGVECIDQRLAVEAGGECRGVELEHHGATVASNDIELAQRRICEIARIRQRRDV
jgi:hypothetical protein